MSINFVLTALAGALIVAGLVFPPLTPGWSNIAVIVLAAIALVANVRSNAWPLVLQEPAVFMPLGAGLLLALAFACTARTPLEVGAVFYFAPLFGVAPLVLLLDRLPANKIGWIASSAALVASVGAAAVASYGTFVLGQERAGISVANPIHFADIALMLGFVALAGSVWAERWRWIYLLGPVLAAWAVYLSGSRGPLVALVGMIACVIAYWAVTAFARPQAWLRAALVIVAYGAVVVIAYQFGAFNRLGRFAEVSAQLQSGTGDDSTAQRLAMYQTAYAAFLASPLYGHGLVDFIAKTAAYAPPGVHFPRFEHLHNDIADFAVVGGIAGLLAYVMILLAPLLQAVRAPAGRQRRGAVLLAIGASAGYLGMGLTNAMFGILAQTMLYAVMLAVLTAVSWRHAESRPVIDGQGPDMEPSRPLL